MRPCFAQNPSRGQTALEYLLLLAVVAVVVIASFHKGSLVDQVQNTAGSYYGTVTQVIMGNNPKPINGGWCPVTYAQAGTAKNPNFGPTTMYRTCECPPPAFGGLYCTGSPIATPPASGLINCVACPAGQICVPNGSGGSKCECPNDLSCGSVPGSFPNDTCTACVCPYGYYWDQNKKACEQYCADPCTVFNGSSCAAATCGANQTCNPKAPPSSECACNQYTVWNGYECAYCTATGSGASAQCTAPNASATACVAVTCGTNQYCNANDNACECIAGTYWKGTQCVKGSCTPQTVCQSPYNCGVDTCGGDCDFGTKCPAGQQCGDISNGVGTCVSKCLACQTWNGTACVSTTPCGSNTCGTDSCGNSCGKCTAKGQVCSSSTPGDPGICCLSCQTLLNGACTSTTACGSDNCGTDSCGNSCGTCAKGHKCSGGTDKPGMCS